MSTRSHPSCLTKVSVCQVSPCVLHHSFFTVCWIVSIRIQTWYYFSHLKKKQKHLFWPHFPYQLPFLAPPGSKLLALSLFSFLHSAWNALSQVFALTPPLWLFLTVSSVISMLVNPTVSSHWSSYLSVNSACGKVGHSLLPSTVSLYWFPGCYTPSFPSSPLVTPSQSPWDVLLLLPEDLVLESPRLSPWPLLFPIYPHSLSDLTKSHDYLSIYMLSQM